MSIKMISSINRELDKVFDTTFILICCFRRFGLLETMSNINMKKIIKNF